MDGIQVYNSIDAVVVGGVDISSIVGATAGAGVGTPLRPLVSVSNVSVNKNPIDFIATIGYEATTYGTIRLDNIVVPKLKLVAFSIIESF